MVSTQSGAASYGRAPHPVSLKHGKTPGLSHMGPAVSPPGTDHYRKMPSPQVQDEILKHEAHQSKVTMLTKCKVCSDSVHSI